MYNALMATFRVSLVIVLSVALSACKTDLDKASSAPGDAGGKGGAPSAGGTDASGDALDPEVASAGTNGNLAGAGGSGGISSEVQENNYCPGNEDPEHNDQDADGFGDACDLDDDGDGFDDDSDPAPQDPEIPGDFSTPEAILRNPTVQMALRAAEEAGYPIEANTAMMPPDLTGYYHETGARYAASGNGANVGGVSELGEYRVGVRRAAAGAVVDLAAIFPGLYGASAGHLLRGEGDRFTIYSRGKATCIRAGSDYTTYRIGIGSGRIESATGDWVDDVSVSVTIAVEGERTASCVNTLAGNVEDVGGWNVRVASRRVRTDAKSLKYTWCRAEGSAYVPGEIWTSTGGETCECSKAAEVVCAD